MGKKYVSLNKLSIFLDNLKDIFAPLIHTHTVEDISGLSVDSELSSTSTNPVQNKVLDAEFSAISEAMNALEAAIDDKADVSTIDGFATTEYVDEQVNSVIEEFQEITNNEVDTIFSNFAI